MLGIRWKYERLLLMVLLSFSLIRQEEPNWDEALEKLRILASAPSSDNTKEKS